MNAYTIIGLLVFILIVVLLGVDGIINLGLFIAFGIPTLIGIAMLIGVVLAALRSRG